MKTFITSKCKEVKYLICKELKIIYVLCIA